MEINEKLDIFYRAAIEAANEKSGEFLEEQKKAYEQNIAAYEKKKQEELESRVRIAKKQVEKEENRKISEELLQLKKMYHSEQEKRKEELFLLVEDRLKAYRKTEAYREHLLQKALWAKEYAAAEELEIYIDPSDEKMREELAEKTGCKVMVSGEPFGGGLRAVIRSQNLLMDESFDRKLSEEREQFSF